MEKLNKNDVALIGILSDANSSHQRGAAAAPGFIRHALHCGSANLCSELGVDLSGNPCFVDVGDRQVADDPDSFLAIEAEINNIIEQGALPLILGGDHAISYPAFLTMNPAGSRSETYWVLSSAYPIASWARILSNTIQRGISMI